MNRYLLSGIGLLLGIAIVVAAVYSGGWDYTINQIFANQAEPAGVALSVGSPANDPDSGIEPVKPQIKVALVIGNDDYPEKPLNNAAKDAQAIAETLVEIGFEVIEPVIDADFNEMLTALKNFTRKAKQADIALAYYAGHAVQVKGKNYLLPAKMPFKNMDEFDLPKTVRLSMLQEAASSASGLGVVLLDACRDNPFLKKLVTRGGESGTRGLARVDDNKNNLYTGFSTRANDVALDDVGEGHGPYVQALKKHLPEKGEDIRIVMGKVRDTVRELTGKYHKPQEPATYGSLGGIKWLLAGTAAGEPPPFSLVDYREEAKRWLDGDDETRWGKAFTRMLTLADREDPVAMRYLGLMYYSGFRVSEDTSLACRWLAASATTGDTESARYLKDMNTVGACKQLGETNAKAE